MAHPSGHKMIIQHKHLKPEHLEQLHSLPFAGAEKLADGGAVKPKDDVPEPNKKAAADMQKGAMSGGPSASQAFSNLKSGLGFAEGGPIQKENKDQELVDETQSPDLKRMLEMEPRRQSNPKLEQSKMKDGGEVPEPVKPADTPSGDVNATGEYDPSLDPTLNPSLKPKKKLAEGGDPATAPQDNQAEAAPTPEPTPAPKVDPVLQQKRELYNSLAMGPVDAKGGTPDADASTDKQFGPNGEAPKQFDAGVWRQAQVKYQEGQQKQAQEGQQKAASTIEENKAREAAGLAPLPVPAAQAAAQQDPRLQAQVQAETSPKSPSDPYGTQAYSDAFTKGLAEQKAGMQQQAAAESQMGQAQSADLQKGQEIQQTALKNYQTHYQNLENERQSFINDINNNHINPKHYMDNMSTGSKIATAIGLIAGGIGEGFTHTSGNPALQFLNAQIDRDIATQKTNLGASENLLSANMRQFGNLQDATTMTKVMQTDILANQLKQEAAKAQSPLAQARLLQARGALTKESSAGMAQIAMRKTLLSGMQSGHIAPEQVIRSIVPEREQGPAYKELQEAQTMTKARDNALAAFDQITKLNTVGNRLAHPIDSAKQINAIKGAILPALSKETAGRFTEQDAHMIEKIFDTMGAGPDAVNTARAQLNKLVSERMNFPLLRAYGIDMGSQSRYNQSGKSRIPESAPVTK